MASPNRYSMTRCCHRIDAEIGLAVLMILSAGFCSAGEPVRPELGVFDSELKIVWYDLPLLGLEGRGWTQTRSAYDRLPAKAETMVRPEVWSLSRQSSGLCVRFITDARTLYAEWTVGLERLSEWNMTAVAISGLDLYVKQQSEWRWLAVGKPERQKNRVTLFQEIPAGEREYLLYLPLYNVVESARIGLPANAKLFKVESAPSGPKPIVFYGTSITQGGCASRPGMVHTAILGRRLNCPVINLGFRANGTMDQEMAALFTELDPSVYVLDCLPNMIAQEVAERVEPFVNTLRKKRPETPILLVEDRTYPDGFLNVARHERNQASRAALKAAYQRLINNGTDNLFYLNGDKLIGQDGDSTVDASHPTDLGFLRQAEAFEAILRPLLKQN